MDNQEYVLICIQQFYAIRLKQIEANKDKNNYARFSIDLLLKLRPIFSNHRLLESILLKFLLENIYIKDVRQQKASLESCEGFSKELITTQDNITILWNQILTRVVILALSNKLGKSHSPHFQKNFLKMCRDLQTQMMIAGQGSVSGEFIEHLMKIEGIIWEVDFYQKLRNYIEPLNFGKLSLWIQGKIALLRTDWGKKTDSKKIIMDPKTIQKKQNKKKDQFQKSYRNILIAKSSSKEIENSKIVNSNSQKNQQKASWRIQPRKSLPRTLYHSKKYVFKSGRKSTAVFDDDLIEYYEAETGQLQNVPAQARKQQEEQLTKSMSRVKVKCKQKEELDDSLAPGTPPKSNRK